MIPADDSRPGVSAPSAGSSRAGRERAAVECDDVSLVRARSETPADAAQLCEAQALIDAFDGREPGALLSEVARLTGVLVSRGATARAGVLLRQALTIGDQHLDRDDADVARVLHELAHVFVREGRYADAEPLLLRLYYMQCRTRGRDHPDTASVLASLARVRQALGRHEDAEAMWRHVIAVCERSLGPQHVATTAAMERLAESCAARGKHSEAGQLRAQASTMRDTPAPPVARPDWLEEEVARSTKDALLAIQAELLASGTSRRRWPALAAAAAVIIALGILTTQPGAARTFAVRPVRTTPTWEVWTPPAPVATEGAGTTDSATFPVRLAADAPAAAAPRVAGDGAFVHARLLGAPPRPALADSVVSHGLAGEVVVRFGVDAQGRPDASSATVVRSPDAMLTEAVRRVIPEMRFEPARRGALAARDEIEMSFRFPVGGER